MNRTAVVVGATGLIGTQLLGQLAALREYKSIVALVRRVPESKSAEIIYSKVDFSSPLELESGLKANDLFFCFGTTLKQAGSRENFREIEWGVSSRVLSAAKKAGVSRVYLVSSMGATSDSRILYSKIKGQIEELAAQLKFERLCIFRPSLLLGERSDNRILEGLAQKSIRPLRALMIGPLAKYRPVEGALVAQRLIDAARSSVPGNYIFENDKIISGIQ